MKKTMTKVLVAFLAAAMMIGAAAGCNNNGSGNTDSSVESTVSASASEQTKDESKTEDKTESTIESKTENKEESTVSETEKVSDTESSVEDSTYVTDFDSIDIKTVTEDKIRYVMTGEETTENYNVVFAVIDDGSEYGYGALAVVYQDEEGGVFSGTMDGAIINDSTTDNEDGSKTQKISMMMESAMPFDITIITSADGQITLKPADEPIEVKMTMIDKSEGLKTLQESYAIENDYSSKAYVMSDAATINNACKVYYASVISGAINDDEWAKNVKADKLPEENATEEERTEAALNCTIQGALEFNGLTDVEFDWSLFGAAEEGTIVALIDESATVAVESVSPTTTFKDLGYDKMITDEDASAESVEE